MNKSNRIIKRRNELDGDSDYNKWRVSLERVDRDLLRSEQMAQCGHDHIGCYIRPLWQHRIDHYIRQPVL